MRLGPSFSKQKAMIFGKCQLYNLLTVFWDCLDNYLVKSDIIGLIDPLG